MTGHRACFNCKFGHMVHGKRYGDVVYVHMTENGGVYLITEEMKETFVRFGCSNFIPREE
jgi:hypothetical protein